MGSKGPTLLQKAILLALASAAGIGLSQRSKTPEPAAVSAPAQVPFDSEVFLTPKNDARMFYVILQTHQQPIVIEGENAYSSKRVARCQAQVFNTLRYLQREKGVDIATLEGYGIRHGMMDPNRQDAQTSRLLLGATENELTSILYSSEADILNLASIIPGLQVYGWESADTSPAESLRKLEIAARDIRQGKDIDLKEAYRVMEQRDEEDKIRSKISYTNSLSLSDRLVGEGKSTVGNVAIVIGSAHGADYDDIAKSLEKETSHPGLTFILPGSCG